MKNTFVTTQHKPIKNYSVVAALPVKTTDEFKTTPIHHIKLALIPKENIGVDPSYQRKINVNQIKNISEGWDYDLYEPVSVYMHRDTKSGLTYYQATDGQHRLCAHPDDSVLCRIVNSKSAVTRCIQANDVNTKKSWGVDDMFWAKKVEIDRVGVEDDTFIMHTIKAFKSKNWNPLHPKKEKATDIGGKIATIHKYFAKGIKQNILTRTDISDAEKKALAQEAITDTVNIMEELYHLTYNAYAGRVWCALFDWLTHPNQLNCCYDYADILQALGEGYYKLKSDRYFREAKTPSELSQGASAAISKRLVTDRQHEGIIYVFNAIFEVFLNRSYLSSSPEKDLSLC